MYVAVNSARVNPPAISHGHTCCRIVEATVPAITTDAVHSATNGDGDEVITEPKTMAPAPAKASANRIAPATR